MKTFFFLPALLILLSGILSAQDNKQYTQASESDPEAKQILERIRAKYDGYETLAADFRLELAFPEQPVEMQRGSMSRRGDMVRFKLGNQEGIINDEAAYIILHGSKEVQINDLPEPGEASGLLTPQNLFSFYEGDDYILAMQGEETFNGRSLQAIELKPVNRNESDFSKLRLLVDTRKNDIVTVKAFSKDGSTYTFFLDDTRGNAQLAENNFTFNRSEFPGYYVEDLRF